jgi:hypothetical protein
LPGELLALAVNVVVEWVEVTHPEFHVFTRNAKACHLSAKWLEVATKPLS